ncbi:CTP-dependent diacylglycerol kinase 1 [Penicillium diatomitis]|uniref:CTP-dependent diacylglycerol kinase 1 n=1 Tax=Penicillium diatomitis TaxID=2819901 RepID=A0A9W9XH40_9EURO|nr:CTP-dependent diacylglycerol kinase 1 [Penicillium diatomitis]KAJ5492891.1 CTP-dependent diacylglycerol kinase 1 [Penicillium diatomitis]
MASSHISVPETPRVISPSPSLSESSEARDGYLAPTTRSASRRQRLSGLPEADSGSERSRSPPSLNPSSTRDRRPPRRSNTNIPASPPTTNDSPSSDGFLSPKLADALRDISRSPSPLGLIPLHTRYRSFIHRHEIPRKLLHVSIGFVTLHLYRSGVQTSQITPVLFTALVPIAATDFLRHRSEKINQLYIRCVGALMRETEVSGYNGVIWYLLGAYVVLRFFPKDVGVMGVLLLSWCDTAASTFGRLWGRHTPQLRRGKSLAGTLAAWLVGVVTAAGFWGWFVPSVGSFPDDPPDAFMFTGRLNLLPDCVRGLLGWEAGSAATTITGTLALGVMSAVSGVVAAGSELIDLWGWDDNLTIPVLSGVGLWGFLKVFG